MDWRSIPSLAALRAFEAVVRLGSVSRAADELNVTHAAVSQHLRKLADELGEPLVIRDGGVMVATEAGAPLAAACSAGFAQIADAVHALRDSGGARPVRLTTTPSFAEFWLMPRLARLWRAYPDVRLSITPETGLSDLRSDGHDLAIRYGRGGWPGFEEERLLPADLAVVMAPSWVGTPTEDLPWLTETTAPEALNWGRAVGLITAESVVQELPNPAMVLAGARAGAGAGIVPIALAEADLNTGALTRLPMQSCGDLSYILLRRPGVMRSQVKDLIRWLRAEARAAQV